MSTTRALVGEQPPQVRLGLLLGRVLHVDRVTLAYYLIHDTFTTHKSVDKRR
jgi:hypothetical protein